MNSNSPVATGAAAVTGAMIGAVVIWLCQIIRVTPPDEVVAGAIGALLLAGGHSVSKFIQNRWPTQERSTVSVPIEPLNPVVIHADSQSSPEHS